MVSHISTSQTLCMCIHIVFFAVQIGIVWSYNVETDPKKVGTARGEKGSQFGYTVAIVRKPGWTKEFKRFFEKELLVGAPNLTYNNVIGHGQVTRCETPTIENITCNSLDLTDTTNLCAKLSRNTDTDCAFKSRLGATMEVNRKYQDVMMYTDKTPMVTACAPGWKNVYPETAKDKYQNYMTGMCLKMRDELKPLPCTERKYCWPFWPDSNTTSWKGRPQFTYAECGMASTFSKNGHKEIISAPGADDWRGAFVSYQMPTLEYARLDFEYTTNTMYFGYALTVAKFWQNEMIISGSPNWNDPKTTGHFGKVYLYIGGQFHGGIEYGIPASKCLGQENIDLRKIEKEQTGTKFGAALAAVDITGDGYDELFVGAPFYSSDSPEEGLVFVYSSSKDNSFCGPIGILSGGVNVASLKSGAAFARFGTSIASVGDLDQDDYNDIAVGAPYEDDGAGAVYIYPGIGECNCNMEDLFTQRIAGRELDSGLRSFGWSIYGDEDIDDNTFPDVAIGAYESDTAYMFRARPIVNVMVKMEMNPNPIPLNVSSLGCSKDRQSLCFTVDVEFRFESVGTRAGIVSDVKLEWILDSDTLHKSKEGWSRVSFSDKKDQDSKAENITLKSGFWRDTYTIYVKRYRGKLEPKDAWTKVRMEGSYKLIPSSEEKFAVLDPILSKDNDAHIVEDIEFDKKCDSIITCTSDLKLNVEMFLLKDGGKPTHVNNETVLYVDAANMLQVTTDVINLLNSSYRANISSEVTTLMKKDASPNNGLVGASCKYESPHQISTLIYCTADSKLDRNENMKIKMFYDVTRQRLIPGMDLNKMKESIHITMHADQANLDTDRKNNYFERTIPVKLKFEIHIQSDKEISDQVRYKADEESTRKLSLVHRYIVTNEGPSFLPKTYVNITIPLLEKEAEFARIVELPTKCVYRGQAIVDTTTQATTTAKTTKFSLPPDTKPERKRREVKENAKTAQSKDNNKKPVSKAKNITCNDDFTCEVIECEVLNLEPKKQHTIDIKIDVFENILAKQKEYREVHYATNATVTDPFIWYGGKVVPWDKTVYAEKWTTFVVEPTSVVSEVDIWIIIGSVLGALALLIIVIIILWKCGFFARKKHSEVQKWKRASLYNRKSVRLSATTEKQPYSAIEDKEN